MTDGDDTDRGVILWEAKSCREVGYRVNPQESGSETFIDCRE